MQWAPLLEATADSIKRHALDFRLEHGGEIPGYELRSRSGKKRIVNAPMAWEEAKKLGVSQEEFLRCVDVRASDLADAAAEHAPRGKKGSVKQTLEDALRDAGALEIGLNQGNFAILHDIQIGDRVIVEAPIGVYR